MSLPETNQSCDCGEPHEDLIKYLESEWTYSNRHCSFIKQHYVKISNSTHRPEFAYRPLRNKASVKNIVTEVTIYNDRYILNYGVENAINKYKDLDELINQKLEIFLKHEAAAVEMNRAYYYYLKGKLLNINPTYNSESESLLSKAIKLDPKIVDAWNELGESYCKFKSFRKARSCFEGGLKEKRNKVSLRNLGMVLRREELRNPETFKENLEMVIAYSKEAVQMDPQDGKSWINLGTAQMYTFFETFQSPNAIKQCLSAYAQAEKDINCKTAVDLHFNKGVIFKYQEDYKLALQAFSTAALYEPMWEEPKLEGSRLFKYLQEIVELIRTKGKLKPKRLQRILRTISSKDLGPYAGAQSNTDEPNAIHEVAYDNLQPGLNKGKVILGKVICSVRTESAVPFTFCSIDKAGSVIVTTVYNLADGKGVIIGDAVAIREPLVTDIDFSYRDDHFKFRSVRVQNPMTMVVNGKQLSRDFVSKATFTVFNQI